MMKDLMAERVPANLQSLIKGDADVGLDDRSKEVFEKKVNKDPVQGEGMVLGNVGLEDKVKNLKIENVSIKIETNEQSHELMIKYPNGEKKVITVNPSTKFKVVKDLIEKQLKNSKFKITTPPFPVRDVTNETKTLAELDLLDSSITVSLVWENLKNRIGIRIIEKDWQNLKKW